jgi:hypothetical protein
MTDWNASFTVISNNKYPDMLLAYGEYNQNANEVQCIFQQRCPERRLPSVTTVSRVERCLQHTGMFNRANGRKEDPVTSDVKENMLDIVPENLHKSTTSTAQQVDISQFSVIKILKNKFHPYNIQLHQELHGSNFGN